jgi:hypothetical protein
MSVPAVSLLQAPLFIAIDAGALKNTAWTCGTSLPRRARFRAPVVGSVHFARAGKAEFAAEENMAAAIDAGGPVADPPV